MQDRRCNMEEGEGRRMRFSFWGQEIEWGEGVGMVDAKNPPNPEGQEVENTKQDAFNWQWTRWQELWDDSPRRLHTTMDSQGAS
eukprot:12183723-Karenia_brevis.AAC.1